MNKGAETQWNPKISFSGILKSHFTDFKHWKQS